MEKFEGFENVITTIPARSITTTTFVAVWDPLPRPTMMNEKVITYFSF